MTDDELRAIVRAAVSRHLANAPVEASPGRPTAVDLRHTSHLRLALPSGDDGPCLIEPSVMCNHCGYCQSYGH